MNKPCTKIKIKGYVKRGSTKQHAVQFQVSQELLGAAGGRPALQAGKDAVINNKDSHHQQTTQGSSKNKMPLRVQQKRQN